jgi:hypothetical protein
MAAVNTAGSGRLAGTRLKGRALRCCEDGKDREMTYHPP